MTDQISALTHYKPHSSLLFLISHDEEHAEALGVGLTPIEVLPSTQADVLGKIAELDAAKDSPVVKDVNAKLTIKGQQVTINLSDGFTFLSSKKYDFYTLQIPPIQDEPGVFYRRNLKLPQPGSSSFFISQYPTFFGERGRIVVDVWVNDNIVGVFKTNSSNFGAGGRGEWTRPPHNQS